MDKRPLKSSTFILALAFIGFMACKENHSPEAKKTATHNEAAQNTDKTFTNPLLPSGPDPWAIYHEGNYYYIKSGGGGIILMRTPDITDLQNAEKKVIWKAPETDDHSREIWAPEIHNINDNWYIYVAADDG